MLTAAKDHKTPSSQPLVSKLEKSIRPVTGFIEYKGEKVPEDKMDSKADGSEKMDVLYLPCVTSGVHQHVVLYSHGALNVLNKIPFPSSSAVQQWCEIVDVMMRKEKISDSQKATLTELIKQHRFFAIFGVELVIGAISYFSKWLMQQSRSNINLVSAIDSFTRKVKKITQVAIKKQQKCCSLLIECGAEWRQLFFLERDHAIKGGTLSAYAAVIDKKLIQAANSNTSLSVFEEIVHYMLNIEKNVVMEEFLRFFIEKLKFDVNTVLSFYGTFLHQMLANEEPEQALKFINVLEKLRKEELCAFDYTVADKLGDKIPLHIAALLQQNQVINRLVELNKEEKIDIGLNKRDAAGRTALLISAALGNAAAVDTLLKAGADPTIKDNDGHDLAWYANASEEEVKKLLESIHVNPARAENAKRNWIYYPGENRPLVCDKSTHPDKLVLASKNVNAFSLCQEAIKVFDSATSAGIAAQVKGFSKKTILQKCLAGREEVKKVIAAHTGKNQIADTAAAVPSNQGVKQGAGKLLADRMAKGTSPVAAVASTAASANAAPNDVPSSAPNLGT